MIVLTLPTPSTVPVVKAVAAQTTTVSFLTVEYYLERPEARILQAKFVEIPYDITVWEGDEYDKHASNWTDDDVSARMKELFPN